MISRHGAHTLLTLFALLLRTSEIAFAEFENCEHARAKFEDIKQLVCGNYDGNRAFFGIAQNLESLWLLLFLASMVFFPLFPCTCQIVIHVQQVQLDPIPEPDEPTQPNDPSGIFIYPDYQPTPLQAPPLPPPPLLPPPPPHTTLRPSPPSLPSTSTSLLVGKLGPAFSGSIRP